MARIALLSLSLCFAAVTFTLAAGASAQPAPLFDPQQLPSFHGKVAFYSLTPWGGVDGLILDDGSQVRIGGHLSTQIAALAKPGDQVTVHGVKASSGGLILAASIANDAGGKPLMGGGGRRESVVVQGRIKAALRNGRDEVDGVLLEDGSQIRLRPREAARIAAQLTPGQTVYASGFGQDDALGKVVMPRRIGATEADAKELVPPGTMGVAHHDEMSRDRVGPAGTPDAGPAR